MMDLDGVVKSLQGPTLNHSRHQYDGQRLPRRRRTSFPLNTHPKKKERAEARSL
jgi:hypothetical protein